MGKAVAFQAGPLVFYWYGLIIATAILLGFLVAWWQVRLRGENPDRLIDILFYGLPSAIVGARLFYVIFNWDYYRANTGEIFALWHGGLAIHGAIIAGVIAGAVYTKNNRLDFWHWGDIVAPSIILGQAIGRWGNFINQEAFGYPTDYPWGIYIDFAHRPPGYEDFDFFHPTFLYESLWDFAVFIGLVFVSRWQRLTGRLVPGGVLLSYGIFYSVGRFFIEGLRLDSLMLGPFRVAQILSILIVLGGSIGLVHRQKRWQRRETVNRE